MYVFQEAFRLFHSQQSLFGFTIGGGEPTLHPNFWEMMYYTINEAHLHQVPVSIITNGSDHDSSLLLAGMAKNGVVRAWLSYDNYHDKSLVSREVFEAFNELFAIRSSDNKPVIAQGRAKSLPGAQERCGCDEMTITADGRIFHCGCMNHHYGTVFAPQGLEEFRYLSKNGVRCHGFEYEKMMAFAQIPTSNVA